MIQENELYYSYLSRGINQERLDTILKFAGDSILDVGCGGGAYVLELNNQYQIKGVDYQKFSSWDKMPQLFSIGDASDLSCYTDSSVDTILSFETLEHLEYPQKALQEYYRVCRKNLILTVPNCEISNGMLSSGLIYKTWIDRTHVQFFDLDSITSLTEEVGFHVSEKKYINQISLLPLMLEAFDQPNIKSKLIRKMLKITNIEAKKYYLTCLLVCEKI